MTVTEVAPRRKRRTRQELREEVLQEGVALLAEKGVSVKPSSLTFPKVFERIQQRTGRKIVPAMVYERIWANQEEYQWDVLATFIARNNDAEIETVELVQSFIGDSDRSTREACERVYYDVMRLGTVINLDDKYLINSWAAVAIAHHSMRNATSNTLDRVAVELKRVFDKQSVLYGAMYMWAIENLGLRIREPYSLDHYVNIVGSAGEGCEIRRDYDSRYSEVMTIAVEPDVDPADWTIFGLVLWAMSRSMVEVDPDFEFGNPTTPFPVDAKQFWERSLPRNPSAELPTELKPEPNAKPKRRTRSQLRDEVLVEGLTLLEEEGLSVKLDHLTLPAVFDRIEEKTGRRIVPAMVYERIWRSQTDYQWDVLRSFISGQTQSSSKINEFANSRSEQVDRSTDERRRVLYSDLLRLGSLASFEDDSYPVNTLAAVALMSTRNEGLPGELAAVKLGFEEFYRQRRAFSEATFASCFAKAGYRVREPFTLGIFTDCAGAIAEGLFLRRSYDERYSTLHRLKLEGDDHEHDWSLYGIALAALAEAMLEPDPDLWPTR